MKTAVTTSFITGERLTDVETIHDTVQHTHGMNYQAN